MDTDKTIEYDGSSIAICNQCPLLWEDDIGFSCGLGYEIQILKKKKSNFTNFPHTFAYYGLDFVVYSKNCDLKCIQTKEDTYYPDVVSDYVFFEGL